MTPAAFEDGLLVGLLVGEGHFGGDGRQPQVTLRMHVRHEALFRWLEQTNPGGRLYGPYTHGGRRYYQWMLRGTYLRKTIVPLLERCLTPAVDRYAYTRFTAMCTQYRDRLGGAEPTRDAPAASRDREERSGDVGAPTASGPAETTTTRALRSGGPPGIGSNASAAERAADAFRSLRAGTARDR